ncbi:unnamed protein product [Prorocentrum cordatum]|uniref:Uncharacterized protein n=1 Tax=Prorocentrum cordatum TaxID=2364126 RepID=A0ABN9XI49_9DINO|nr:unnamed protein product [Polarella glacialis]
MTTSASGRPRRPSAQVYCANDYEAAMRAICTMACWDGLDLPSDQALQELSRSYESAKCTDMSTWWVATVTIERQPAVKARKSNKKKGCGRGRDVVRQGLLSFG